MPSPFHFVFMSSVSRQSSHGVCVTVMPWVLPVMRRLAIDIIRLLVPLPCQAQVGPVCGARKKKTHSSPNNPPYLTKKPVKGVKVGFFLVMFWFFWVWSGFCAVGSGSFRVVVPYCTPQQWEPSFWWPH